MKPITLIKDQKRLSSVVSVKSVVASGLVAAALFVGALCLPSRAAGPSVQGASASAKQIPQVAAVVTAYYHNSHADVIVSRLLQTMTLDGKGERPALKLVSLYVDQPESSEFGLEIARKFGVPVYKTVAGALTQGGKSLAVDGVLLIGEHGRYPLSATSQVMFPKRRLFSQILDVFDHSGRIVPVYTDKHLADNWEDAKWLYDSSRRRGIPLMAGSSLPVAWRYPPLDLPRGARISEIAATAYGSFEAYGFHGLEIIECLAERRAGGETGVRSVQTLAGAKIWEAARAGVFSRELLEAALSRRGYTVPASAHQAPRAVQLERDLVNPAAVVVNYRDGLRGTLLYADNLNEWTAAWRDARTGQIESTHFWTQEARPFMHFTYLLKGIEQMIRTGKPAWPAERTLLTTGILNAYFVSKKEGGRLLETPWLDIRYQSDRDWRQPPPPPRGRPVQGQ
jgi:hypothetical protein